MSETFPPVSYVVTVYNKASFLPRVLAAIAAERRATAGEIILVDDGSTDSSPEILARFANGEPAARIVTQQNRGVAAATNTGLAQAACLYTRLIDADDVIVPGSTEKLIAGLHETGCGFGYGAMVIEGQESGSHPARPDEIVSDPLKLMLTRQPFIPSMSLGVTELMQRALPLPEDVCTSQDFSLGIKLAALTKFVVIDAPCCVVPANSGGLSASKATMFRDTVILASRLGREMAWAPSYRRLALARNAGRARNYLRRHAPEHRGRIAGASALAIVARLPLPWPYAYLMSYLVSAYRAVLSTPGKAP